MAWADDEALAGIQVRTNEVLKQSAVGRWTKGTGFETLWSQTAKDLAMKRVRDSAFLTQLDCSQKSSPSEMSARAETEDSWARAVDSSCDSAILQLMGLPPSLMSTS